MGEVIFGRRAGCVNLVERGREEVCFVGQPMRRPMPPSTGRMAPVMKRASSEARKRAA
jgi:hypothetical protein